jgi:hypothetical protein
MGQLRDSVFQSLDGLVPDETGYEAGERRVEATSSSALELT